ncbi:hypothetical protein [Nonomuraea typhae]|uniref:hypothetical protein n=1 Tax=Nonomuraea typhae TaxID=2603600 RepID=UPI0012FCB7E9|nr:hypothetical protein [Nonomuraea typhae]
MLLNLFAAGTLALTGGAQTVEDVWLTKYQALEAQIGGSSYRNPDSATLAWGESYIMRSYLDVYQATGDTAWLDKLVTHADTVIANADDVDGDGFLGWSTSRYSPVELANPGFESAASGDATLPASWTRFQDTGSHVHRTTDRKEGAQAVRVISDQAKWKKLYQNVNSAYEGGSAYVLRGWGKKSGSVTGRIVLRNGSATVCALDYTSTAWEFKQVECKLPAGGAPLRVWLEHASYTVAGSASFDEVKLSGRFPYMVHDAMIGIPVAEFVRLVAQTPALSGYSAKAATYRGFLETEIVPRWEQSGYLGNTWNGTTWQEPPDVDTFSHTRVSSDLPFNQALGFANLLTVLHGVNGDAAYLQKANSTAQWAKRNLVNSGGAYIWNYASYTTTKEDLSHANVDLSAFLESYRRGQVFTAADMTAFKNTLKTKMWNGSATAPVFSQYVNGTGTANGADYYLHSWLELAEWDPQIKDLVAAKYATFTPANSGHLITLSRLLK